MKAARVQNAIHDAFRAFENGNLRSWCLPLVETLESGRTGNALEWLADMLTEVVTAERDTPAGGVRWRWIAELRSVLQSGSDAAELQQRSRTIWFHGSERDETQTAIAKAYEAAAAYKDGNTAEYQRCIAGTMSHVILADVESTMDKRVQLVIKLFQTRSEEMTMEVSDE